LRGENAEEDQEEEEEDDDEEYEEGGEGEEDGGEEFEEFEDPGDFMDLAASPSEMLNLHAHTDMQGHGQRQGLYPDPLDDSGEGYAPYSRSVLGADHDRSGSGEDDSDLLRALSQSLMDPYAAAGSVNSSGFEDGDNLMYGSLDNSTEGPTTPPRR
jgi:hypothetical protein